MSSLTIESAQPLLNNFYDSISTCNYLQKLSSLTFNISTITTHECMYYATYYATLRSTTRRLLDHIVLFYLPPCTKYTTHFIFQQLIACRHVLLHLSSLRTVSQLSLPMSTTISPPFYFVSLHMPTLPSC